MSLSPADRQAEALEDVDRIWGAYTTICLRIMRERITASAEDADLDSVGRAAIYELLTIDIIRVGARPHKPPSLQGQTNLIDELESMNGDLP